MKILIVQATDGTTVRVSQTDSGFAYHSKNVQFESDIRSFVEVAATEGLSHWKPHGSSDKSMIVLQQQLVSAADPNFFEVFARNFQDRFPTLKVWVESPLDEIAVMRRKIRGQLLEMRKFTAMRSVTDEAWSTLDQLTLDQLRNLEEDLRQ